MVQGQVDGLVREERGPTYYRAHLAFGFGSPSPSGKAGKGVKRRGGDEGKAQPAQSSKRRKKTKFYDARESLPGVDEYGMLLPPRPSTRPAAAAAPAQRVSAPAAAPCSAAPTPKALVPAASAPAPKGTGRTAGSTKKGATAAAAPVIGATKRAGPPAQAAAAAAGAPNAFAPRAATQCPAAAAPAVADPTESATRTTAASPARPQPTAAPPPPAAVPTAAVSQSPASRPALLPTQPASTSTAVTAGGRAGAKKGEGGKRRRKKEKKTLSPKSKRAAVLKVVAQSAAGTAAQQAQQLQPSPASPRVAAQPSVPAAAVPAAAAAPAAVAAAVPVAASQQAPVPAAAAVAAPQQAPAAALAAPRQAPAASAAAPAAAAVPPEYTRNLGKSWGKEDITTLARLATDPAFLEATIPDHPPGGELDWERIAKLFGRYSAGGKAVQAQYRLVLRTMKEARHEGRKGISYVDLVKTALLALPDRKGTVYEVQQYLKEKHSGSLDKYRDSGGALRWKKAVGEVLRSEKALFEQLGKTPTGKILWGLKAGTP